MRFTLRQSDQPQTRRARIATPVTASAEPVNRQTGGGLRKLNQQWQTEALGFYDTCELCWYPAQSYARVFQRIRFYPAILNERGEPEEVEDGPLVDLWQRIRDPTGGITELTGSYARLRSVIGDGYLTVSDSEGDEVWEYLSPLELRVEPNEGTRQQTKYRRLRAPGLETEQLVEANDDEFEPVGDEARVYRLWQRHPTYSQWADSSLRPILPLFALLERLTLAAGADSLSRAASRGGLYVPAELDFADVDAEVNDEDAAQDRFVQELAERLMANIADPGSAGAMSPIIIRGPAVVNTQNGQVPMADCLRWFPLGPDDRYREAEMWEKTIHRIALGLDLPPEWLTGAGNLNHWGGWLVDEQAFRLHFAPGAQNFATDIVASYLRPAAEEEGLPEWERVVVGFDAAEAINHPDEVKSAREAYRDGVVSDKFYRDKIGATDDDAATEEDRDWILLLLGKAPIEEPEAEADVEEDEAETSPADGGRGGDADEGAPEQDDGRNGRNGASAAPMAAVVAARVLGASEVTVERARELAGSRLVTRSRGCVECRDEIRDVEKALIAATLGPDRVREILNGHGGTATLVHGAGAQLAVTLVRLGLEGSWAAELSRLVEEHALRTLFEQAPPPLPSGFAVAVTRAVRA